MISTLASLLLLAAQSQSRAELFEFPDQVRDYVSLEAVVRLPKTSPDARFVLETVLESLPFQTTEYDVRMMARVVRYGGRVETESGTDYLRIGFSVMPEDLKPGLALMESLLLRPSFQTDTLKSAGSTVSVRDSEPWRRGAFSERVRPFLVPPQVAESYWRTYVNREAITVGVAGKFEPGQPTDVWNSRIDGWGTPPPLRNLPELWRYPTLPSSGSAVSSERSRIAVGSGKILPNTDPGVPIVMLAMAMLGTGKGSLLWRVSREELGFSYRQEAFLVPDPDGWVPRVVLNCDGAFDSAKMVASLNSQVSKLTDADLRRAIGVTRSSLEIGMPLSPIQWNPAGEGRIGLSEETFRKLYWGRKTQTGWNTGRLVKTFDLVRLDEAKDWLDRFLTTIKFEIR